MSTLMLWGCAELPQIQPGPETIRGAQVLVDQGTLHLRTAELDRAGSEFRLAWDMAQLPAALDGLGAVMFRQGDYAAAEKLFLQAAQLDESYPEALANLALLYEAQGLKEKAGYYYQLALERGPANARARNNYAAYIVDNDSSSRSMGRARAELFKAEAVMRHPVISANIQRVVEGTRPDPLFRDPTSTSED